NKLEDQRETKFLEYKFVNIQHGPKSALFELSDKYVRSELIHYVPLVVRLHLVPLEKSIVRLAPQIKLHDKDKTNNIKTIHLVNIRLWLQIIIVFFVQLKNFNEKKMNNKIK
ncbi:hypothetical protein BpHYR1_042933, partial [Brachionus plicatilis]